MKKLLICGMLLASFVLASAENNADTSDNDRLSSVARYHLFGGYGHRSDSF